LANKQNKNRAPVYNDTVIIRKKSIESKKIIIFIT